MMDWEMPVMDGIESTRRLREMERKGQVTILLPGIATTANMRSEQVNEAFSAGADHLLAKNFTVITMMTRIESIMGKMIKFAEHLQCWSNLVDLSASTPKRRPHNIGIMLALILPPFQTEPGSERCHWYYDRLRAEAQVD